MKRLNEILHWLENRRDLAYSLIRIYLGIALFVRGWILLSDPSAITELVGAQQVYWWYAYIISAHLLGGLLLALGLLTRWAALLQLPILLGAVIFIHAEQGLMTVGQSLEVASLVLFLLCVYVLFGSGAIALDTYFAREQTKPARAVEDTGLPA
jgi:putative oxidoreductase